MAPGITLDLLLGSGDRSGNPEPSRGSSPAAAGGAGAAVAAEVGRRSLAAGRGGSLPVARARVRGRERGARGEHRVTAAAAGIDARGSLEARAAPPAPGRAAAQPTQGTARRRAAAHPDTLPKKGNVKMESQPAISFPPRRPQAKSTINKIMRKESIRRIEIQSPLPSALGWQPGPVFSDPRIQPLLHELFRSVGILCIFFMNTCFK